MHLHRKSMKEQIQGQLINFNYSQVFSFKSFQSIYAKLQNNIKQISIIFESLSAISCSMRSIANNAKKACNNEKEIDKVELGNLELLIKIYMYYHITQNNDRVSKIYEK